MNIPPEVLWAIAQAAAAGLLSGLVSGGAILIAVRVDVRWLKKTLGELTRDVNHAHRRIDRIHETKDRHR